MKSPLQRTAVFRVRVLGFDLRSDLSILELGCVRPSCVGQASAGGPGVALAFETAVAQEIGIDDALGKIDAECGVGQNVENRRKNL